MRNSSGIAMFAGALTGIIGGCTVAAAVKYLVAIEAIPPIQDRLIYCIAPGSLAIGVLAASVSRLRNKPLAPVNLGLMAIPYGVGGAIAVWLVLVLFGTALVVITAPLLALLVGLGFVFVSKAQTRERRL